ncbi:amidohydrolase family protein [Bradyrhizobium tunisiense]|uniref:amidohydrolase family protein n=1 Tax=Bradyrhizobium tunisiense TaxID=3278709 RepID=UPI0035DDE3B1
MNTVTLSHQREANGQDRMRFIDCDVHPAWKSIYELNDFLSERWREHLQIIGRRRRKGREGAMNYPRMSPGGGTRMDAWLPDGAYPGSDLPFMQKQLLDFFNVEFGLLIPSEVADDRNVEFGAAMATAVNEWQLARWCDRDARLRGAVQVSVENERAAITEIEKRAGDRRFVQVQLPQRGLEPLGRRRYRSILQACAANGFPVAVHIGGEGHPSTGGGWPSFYLEEHPAYVQAMQNMVTSLVCEGVFEEIPNLKVVLIEAGFAWLPSLCWRLDKSWKHLRAEVPFLRQQPSEYVRQNIWLTTQPVEEPERPHDLLSTLEWIGVDRVMLSTDYPHWDQDDPRFAFKVPLPEEWKRKIFHENARTLYGLG